MIYIISNIFGWFLAYCEVCWFVGIDTPNRPMTRFERDDDVICKLKREARLRGEHIVA